MKFISINDLFCFNLIFQNCVSVAGGGGGGGVSNSGGVRFCLNLRSCSTNGSSGGGGGVSGAGSDGVSDYPPNAAAVRNREAAAAALHAARTLLGAGVANPCSPTPESPFWKMPHKGQ